MQRRTLMKLAVMGMALKTVPARAQTEGGPLVPNTSGRIPVNGVELYYEIHGEGTPLVMLHGGVNPSDMFGAPLAAMAEAHQVIAIHMRGHGFSTDADVPWSTEQMADDVAALLGELGIARADVMGWSLGGGVALQTAIRHPELVRKLVVISIGMRADGNFPEVREQFRTLPERAAEFAPQLAQSPLGALYPDVDWEVMFRKSGEMNQGSYDWSADVARIAAPTLLIFADADMMYLEHMVEFYRLLGGGTRDAGFDGSLRPTPNQLAIIPGATHYDLMVAANGSATSFAKAFLAQ